MSKQDLEVLAIARVRKIVEKLTPAAQQRVLAFVGQRADEDRWAAQSAAKQAEVDHYDGARNRLSLGHTSEGAGNGPLPIAVSTPGGNRF